MTRITNRNIDLKNGAHSIQFADASPLENMCSPIDLTALQSPRWRLKIFIYNNMLPH
jgi:hypothetical protein